MTMLEMMAYGRFLDMFKRGKLSISKTVFLNKRASIRGFP